MTDNLEYRSVIENTLPQLAKGQAVMFDAFFVADAYPPLGMDLFSVMTLEFGGNRPEPVQTTEDRFREKCERLGLSLRQSWEPSGAPVWLVYRDPVRCEKCRGGAQQISRQPTLRSGYEPQVDQITATVTLEPCSVCEGTVTVAKPHDDTIRHGDYSASDAWIERQKAARGQENPEVAP